MRHSTRRAAIVALFTSTALSAAPAFAQEAADEADDDIEIVVTAQKRSESLQNVPISIQALGTAKLDQLNIADFKDYARQLPSVSFQTGGSPGSSSIYMRGVASGGDGNHSGSLPSVGVYLDEQPVTTIGGNLDVHIYDIARIESLAGPQGTLYGASSQAGTLRIITNKPSTAGFEGRVDGEINTVKSGDIGGTLEGMVNAPLSDRAALRVVGFYQRDAGFIDNVAGTRCFLPQPGGFCFDNSAVAEKNYNDTETWGGRAALQVDLDDNWTVTPAVMYQDSRTHGTYAFQDGGTGDLEVQRFFPESGKDRFVQAALTIEGKLGNWDLTYAGAYLDRKTSSTSDYTDYAEAYDALYADYGGLAGYLYFEDSAGNDIDPRQHITGGYHYKKLSQELRVASPASDPFRVVAGAFYQRQTNDIYQDYIVDNLSPLLSVNGSPGTLWLTKQYRVDKDYAMFGEASYDVTDTFTLTAGIRGFIYDNSLIGFFGFGRDPAFVQGGDNDVPPNAIYSTRTGVAGCFTTSGERLRDAQLNGTPYPTLIPGVVAGTPCTNLGRWTAGTGVIPERAQGSGVTYRFNATWKPMPGVLLYGTVSKGFRPGGINRRGDKGPYDADYLKNYEIGWKISPMPGMRLNGAVYRQDWQTFQFSFLGENSFTVIQNGPDARIWGAELDFGYSAGPLSLNVNGSWTDAKTTKNLCEVVDPTYTCADSSIIAPSGTRLPVTPQWKLAGTARYGFDVGAARAYAQVNGTWQSSASSDVRTASAADLGRLEAYGTLNLAVGADWNDFNLELFASNVTDERGQASRYQQCGQCSTRIYIVPIQPRTIGLRVGTKF